MKLHKMIKWISLMILLIAGMGQAVAQQVEVTGLNPEKELPEDSVLKPGLVPVYIYKFFKSVDQMPTQDIKTTPEKVGKPILFLDHNFGKEDLIFDSGVSQGIGIQMDGFLKFSEPGKYTLKTKSNDGICVWICDKRIVYDPGVHTDHFSNEVVLDIQKPGWYPLMIKYFQRKGTAAIAMYWKLPRKADFSVIPAEAYAHNPVSKGSS
ncbi:MAG: hypothetical protein HY881_11135 [Deltaproteobacteria bacterium]|nr:hypothetical protein [Deltaproteobacteria bacterium]